MTDETENKQTTEPQLHVLFDLDGVLLDTEDLYTDFWNKIKRDFLVSGNLAQSAKGQSPSKLIENTFVGRPDVQAAVTDLLYEFEYKIPYVFFPGAETLLKELKEAGVPMALVTSSPESKMRNVRRKLPAMEEYFTKVITSDMFTASKPDPECFMMGMEAIGGSPADSIVVEDSVNGLLAGRASGAAVVGIASSNPRSEIESFCDYVADSIADVNLALLKQIADV